MKNLRAIFTIASVFALGYTGVSLAGGGDISEGVNVVKDTIGLG